MNQEVIFSQVVALDSTSTITKNADLLYYISDEYDTIPIDNSFLKQFHYTNDLYEHTSTLPPIIEIFNKNLRNSNFIYKYQKLIRNIKELSFLEKNWNGYEALPIEKKSIRNCQYFIDLIKDLLSEKIKFPLIDPHPDGEASLVWRDKNIGILSISFSKDNLITYACFLPKNNKKHKGKLTLEKTIDPILLALIENFKA